MKKTAVLLLSAMSPASFVSCGFANETQSASTDATTVATTAESEIIVAQPGSKVQHDIKLNTDLTALQTVTKASEPTTEDILCRQSDRTLCVDQGLHSGLRSRHGLPLRVPSLQSVIVGFNNPVI
ncbi:MAG: hypothetical protein ACI3YH_04480 [Eubacteriales bacterium]